MTNRPPQLPFGTRLRAAMDQFGPLCVGIDPHSGLLTKWGLTDDVAGLREFSFTVLDALSGQVAAVKPQVAFFERFGSPGIAVLEDVIRYARELNTLCVVDAKRGDIGSTMAGYADAFLREGSSLAGDAVTLSPYLGFGSLQPAIDTALANGRGVFVLCLTSNPEGASVQHAVSPTTSGTVAAEIAAAAGAVNREFLATRPMPQGAVSGSDFSHSPADWRRESQVGPLTIRPRRSERWSFSGSMPPVGPAGTVGSVGSVERNGNSLSPLGPSQMGPSPLGKSPLGKSPLGPIGLVVGATIGDAVATTGTDLAELNGPILAPGVGAQGAGADELKAVFGDARQFVLASSSREILNAGPNKADLLGAAQKAAFEAATALRD